MSSPLPRWKVTVLSPVNMKPIWECTGMSCKDIGNKWETETGNDFITHNKLVRISLGRSKNIYVKMERLREFGGYKPSSPSSPTEPEIEGGEVM